MPTLDVAYGTTTQRVRLPDEAEVITRAAPAIDASQDPLALVAAAIDAPVDAPPLREAATGCRAVAVVIPDGTRPASLQPLVMPVVARLAHAGLLPEQIRIVMARGIHAPTPRRTVEAMLGPDLMALKPVQSAPDTPELNAEIGTHPQIGSVRVHRQVADADLVVLIGYVRPHHLAGFGGGPKSLVPGVAERDTVIAAHRLTLDTLVKPDGSIRPQAGRMTRNPFRRALMDVAAAFGKTWSLNAIAGPDGRIVAAVAGDVRTAHAAACDQWGERFAAPETEPGDLVIVGGPTPYGDDLIQAHKALVAASAYAKPGAPVVWAAPAPKGPGHNAFLPWFTAGKLPRHLMALRERFHPYGLTAYSVRRIAKDRPVHVVSEVSKDITRPMGLYAFDDLQAAVDHAVKHHAVGRVIALPDGAA